MRRWSRMGIFGLALAIGAGPALAAEYEIDPSHSQVLFKVKHLGISTVTGRFEEFFGLFSFDEDYPEEASVSTTIDMSSVNTNSEDRDKHLRSVDFFDVESFPEMTFVSQSVITQSDGVFELEGDLTLHGVTQPIIFVVEYAGSASDPWGNDRVAFVATATIDRRDFGIRWNKILDAGGLVVSNRVRIILEVEGIKKQGTEGRR